MPAAAHTMASRTRGVTGSFRASHDSRATAAGIAAITTPAASAEVAATP
jgi:hypothetical protein